MTVSIPVSSHGHPGDAQCCFYHSLMPQHLEYEHHIYQGQGDGQGKMLIFMKHLTHFWCPLCTSTRDRIINQT